MNIVGPARPGVVPGAGLQSGQGNIVENSQVLASGKLTLALDDPTAAALSTVKPSSDTVAPSTIPDQLISVCTVDLLPHLDRPENFVSLGTALSEEEYLTYRANVVPSYSGRARVMLTLEWESANAKWPDGTAANQKDFNTYLGRNAFCVPWVSGWNNTSFNWSDPAAATLLTTSPATYRTTAPEVLTSVIGHGSWEIELSEWASGARFVNLGLQYFQTFDANVTYPDTLHIYYTVLAEAGRDDTYALPQCQLIDGTGLPFNAGLLPTLAYGPTTLAAQFSGTKFDKVNTVQIWNGTNNSISADVRFQAGTGPLSGYELVNAAVGPQTLLAGVSGIWVASTATVPFEAFTAMAHVCRSANVVHTGNVGVWAFGG